MKFWEFFYRLTEVNVNEFVKFKIKRPIDQDTKLRNDCNVCTQYSTQYNLIRYSALFLINNALFLNNFSAKIPRPRSKFAVLGLGQKKETSVVLGLGLN